MISALELQNFRLFESLSLNFNARKVFLCGSNGQGKTTILESLFYLSNLRSFRTSRAAEMITIHEEYASLAADVSFTGWKKRIQAGLGNNCRQLNIDGKHVTRASDFAGTYHTVTFLPDDPEIITGRSQVRRRMLDMFISMIDRDYFTALQMYSTGVRSRNCLLRDPKSDEALIRSYHPLIAEYGAKINESRKIHLRILSDYMHDVIVTLKPELSDLTMKMRTSRELCEKEAYCKRLDSSIEHDRGMGYTSFGPHLDDFDFVADEKSLKLYGSRGQCRTVSFALKAAEFDITQNQRSSRDNTIVIVDDATGDLDKKTQDAFYSRISTAKQVFCTFTELPDHPMSADAQVIQITAGRAV